MAEQNEKPPAFVGQMEKCGCIIRNAPGRGRTDTREVRTRNGSELSRRNCMVKCSVYCIANVKDPYESVSRVLLKWFEPVSGFEDPKHFHRIPTLTYRVKRATSPKVEAANLRHGCHNDPQHWGTRFITKHDAVSNPLWLQQRSMDWVEEETFAPKTDTTTQRSPMKIWGQQKKMLSIFAQCFRDFWTFLLVSTQIPILHKATLHSKWHWMAAV